MHVLTTAPVFCTGSDSELTVDPTPFTVVTATNPRHQPGTRLLIVHENSCVDAVNGAVNGAVATPCMHALTTAPSSPFPHRCVDAVVEPWPEAEIPIHMGSRHQMRVEGKHISGWISPISPISPRSRPDLAHIR